MALRYGYFDSEIIGYDSEGMPILDRAESSDLLCLIFAGLLANGVLAKPGDCFQVMEDEGMRLKIKAGFGLIKGHFAYDDEESEIWISDAPKSYKRIDVVVLRLNNRERKCEIIVKEGTPATNPVAPELIKSIAGDYYELCLAEVRVNSNQTAITQSSIKDTRADSSKCGFITQLIDSIDTSVFFAQLNSFYEEFILKSDRSYDEFLEWAEERKEEITTWQNEEAVGFTEWAEGFIEEWESWAYGKMEVWTNEILEWFDNLKEQLTDNPLVNLQEQIGNLAHLKTETKDNLTAAINEVKQETEDLEKNIRNLRIIRATFDKTTSAIPDIVLDCTFEDLQPGDLILITATNTYNTSAYVGLSTYPYVADSTGERKQIKCQCGYVSQNGQSYRSTTNRGININFGTCNLWSYMGEDTTYTGGIFYSLSNIYFNLNTTANYKSTSSYPLTGTGANNMYEELIEDTTNHLKCVETGRFTNDTITLSLKFDATYLLVTREIAVSTGKIYGYRARIYATPTDANGKVAPSAANAAASSNAGVTLGTIQTAEYMSGGNILVGSYGITLKATATYEVSYALYEFANSYGRKAYSMD